MGKLNFQQSSVSHDHVEIIQICWSGAQEIEKSCAALIFWCILVLFFSRFFDEYKVQKNNIYLKYIFFV